MDETTDGYGTGAVFLEPDARDHEMERIPQVAETLAGAIPDEIDHSSFVRYVYNQGALPSCVPTSTAGMQSVYQSMENEKVIYDPTALYWSLGGNGRNGISSRVVLDYAKEKGMAELAPGTRLNRIESYAFTRDINTICAALASNPPLLCVFAMLLPQDFREGDTNSTVRTSNYHQVLATGYSIPKQRLYFLNSWGVMYGRNGFGSVPFSYLRADNNQNNYFYAYTTRDVLDSQQVPPPVRVIVGIETLVGVPTLRITSGDRYVIRGKGFGTRAGQVFEGWNSGMRSVVSIDMWTDTEIRVTAGKFTSDFNGVISVQGPNTTLQDLFFLTHEGIQFRSGIVTPVPVPVPVPIPTPGPILSIGSYQSVATVPIASSSEGREIEIVFAGDGDTAINFLNRPMKVFWGDQELPIVGRLLPNRLRVLLPDVSITKALAITVVMQDDQSRITGKLLTIRNIR